MRRREFISLLGGAAVVWPLAARAQQAERMRQISMLMGMAETDPFTMGYVRELHDGPQQLGWTDSRNISIHLSLRSRRSRDMHAHLPKNSSRCSRI
jgi:putative tryptophan/tyrosine transport system substrate-binding protein